MTVGALLRDLTARFPQVDFHGASLQLAVGSSRPLWSAGVGKGASGSAGAWQVQQQQQVRAVAVFDANGGTRRTVLLLPTPAAAAPGNGQAPVVQQHQQEAQAVGGGSSGDAVAGVWGGEPTIRLHSQGTVKRAEAAIFHNWFGGTPSAQGDSVNSPRAASSSKDQPTPSGGAAAGPAAGGSGATVANGSSQVGSGAVDSAGGNASGSWDAAWRAAGGLRAPFYPPQSAPDAPVLSGADLRGGVACVAFSPGGELLAALLATAACVVVWRLQGSWTERLAHLGSRGPYCHMPLCYLPVPELQRAVGTERGWVGLGGGVGAWELRWIGEGRLEVWSGRQRVSELSIAIAG